MTWRALLVLTPVALGGCVPSAWHAVSPDHRTDIEVVERQQRTCVHQDRRGQWCFDGVAVHDIVFSPDSRHFAHPARVGDHWTVVKDGVMGALWDGVGSPVFSPTGRRLAYGVLDEGSWRVVVDGAVGERFDSLYAGSIVFDSADTRVAYVARRGALSHVVIDGTSEPGYTAIANVTFSPDGTHVAYTAVSEGQTIIVEDGAAQGHYEAVGALAFSDAGRLAFSVRRGAGWEVIDGESTLGPYRSVHHLAFRPNDSLLTFVAETDSGYTLVTGDVAGPVYQSIDPPVFSMAAERWGYIGRDSAQSTVVVNGRVFHREEYAGNLAFSADGSHFAYVASRGEEAFVVDDVGRYPFDIVIEGTLVFSQDGSAWGCLAGDRQRRKLFVAIKGSSQRPRFDWYEFMRIAWRESVEDDPDGPSADALRAWVSAELELALETSKREGG